LIVMAAHTTDIASPLTVSDQLDAMLLGWLEHVADRRGPTPPDLRATAVLTIAASVLPEIQRLCERWDLTLETRGAVALISGPARLVDGLVAVTGMFRR
jgi:hypothetical protein